MRQNSWASLLTYPVVIEGRDTKVGKWELVYEAETQEVFEFRNKLLSVSSVCLHANSRWSRQNL